MFRTKLFSFVTKYFDALESLFIVVLSVSLVFMIRTTPNSHYFVYASLGCLSLLYWLMGIRPFEKKVAGIRIVTRRIVFIAYLLSCLSIMASLRFDGEVNPMPVIIASLVFLALAVGLLILKKRKLKEQDRITSFIVRSIIFAAVLGWLLYMVY